MDTQIEMVKEAADLVGRKGRRIRASVGYLAIAAALVVTPQAAHKRYRWVRHSERTGAVWHERPLPIRPT